MRLPLEDASSETDISIHFRTHRAEGLLLLAAGSTDFCSVELQSGAVRVRIDLGSGEATLGSPPGLTFNDQRWHHVHIVRSEASIELVVDDIYTTQATTPGRFFELNIYSLYLGAVMGSLANNMFFGNFGRYRGCLKQLSFNSVDLFDVAKESSDDAEVYRVTWGCSAEFGATSDQPISFLQNDSVIVFPRLGTSMQTRITFDVRTRSRNALLVFNSGRLQSSDFLAAEILGGYAVLTVNKGSGVVKLRSKGMINDGMWHQVEIVISPTAVRISVDGERREKRTNFGDNRQLNLHADLNVGGVNLLDRRLAIDTGLGSLSGTNAAAASLIGCLQNFKVNGKLYGFQEALLTHALQPECLWSFACISNPCIDGAICIEEGFYHYRCMCPEKNCFRTGSDDPTSPVQDIVHVQDVNVREGGRTLVTQSNINLLIDFAEYGIRKSAILFTVVNPPQHGEVQVNVVERDDYDAVFTMLDLTGGKVSYVNDGSEATSDSFGIELQFTGVDESVPAAFKKTYGFTLHIQITAWNDKPVIELLKNNELKLVSNTFVPITRDIVNTIDTDDLPRELEYSVQYQPGFDIGYFEITTSLGVRARITSFTQQDVNAGKVRYIHRGPSKQQVRLQVSDGKDISDPQVMIVIAAPLQLRAVENSGLEMPATAAMLIRPANLTFATNAPNQQFDIRYEITEPPYFGNVQRKQYTDDKWVTVATFSQQHIEKDRVRYVHSNPSALNINQDYFKFKVSAMSITTRDFEFIITILKTEVSLKRNIKLVLHGVKEHVITDEQLEAISSIPGHEPDDIIYSIISSPRCGHLLHHSDDQSRQRRLAVGTNFTQADINSGHMLYRLHKMLYSPMQDQFQFRLYIPGNSSRVHAFDISYEPIDTDIKFVNNGLMDVLEGDTKVITREDLYMETANIGEFRFTVIDGPANGVIQLIDPNSGRIIKNNITSFRNDDIRLGNIQYHHDNSENADDLFSFTVTPIIHHSDRIVQEISEFTGSFEIKIVLRNDNPPKRVVKKVFHVVANRGRVITTDDIKYEDPDVDFNSSKLLYTRRAVPNGDFVKADNHSLPVYQFLQQDLADGKIYFKHSGPAYAKTVLWVTDGQFYSTGLLEIQVSDPYVKIVNNTGLAVLKGGNVKITPVNLSIESNLDVEETEIKFIVTEQPRYGKIRKNGREKHRFTAHDLKTGSVVYEHAGGNDLQDQFEFTARVGSTEIHGIVRLKVLLESHKDPPKIVNNKVLVINEKERVTLSSSVLKVEHVETPDREIVYTITTLPQYGSLTLRGGRLHRSEALRRFTQDDINRGKLQYRHKEMDRETDIFTFDVTNGILTLHDLEFVMEIVPNIIPLAVSEFSVVEGERKLLSGDIIKVTNKHFHRSLLDYIIVREPANGWIEDSRKHFTPILQFTQDLMNEGLVYYIHDGSDTLTDEFSVMAKSAAMNKQSNPHTVKIVVIPTNDQPPRIVVNRKMNIWAGSTTPITNDYLQAVDLDTGPSQLAYVISNPNNGVLALVNNRALNIVNFTQTHIDNGQVLFVHEGMSHGEFQFQVNDGVNYDRRRTFSVSAKPLLLTIKTYRPLEVYPGLIQPITRDIIAVVTNDANQTNPITFTLQTKPALGTLVTWINGTMTEITNFTQADVDSRLVGYHHNSVLDTWIVQDSFIYDVSTAFARSISYKTFEISISYENINDLNKKQLIDVGKVEVEEGGQVVIRTGQLDTSMLISRLADSGLHNPSVNYVVSEPPKHGLLIIDGVNATKNTRFTQKNVDEGLVVYHHDHSDSLWDAFHFVIEIEIPGKHSDESTRRASRLTNMFNITVLPINDQPFRLMTKYPDIEVVQGFTANITSSELLTTDPDTPPSDIVYVVVNGPSNGHLVTRDNPDTIINRFSQDDINRQQVVFIQDGSMDSGAFYFRVTDGKFKPFYKVFNVRVHPLTLEIINNSAVDIIQGHSSVMLTAAHLGTATNGHRSKIMYNVTRPPIYGQLYLNNRPAFRFSQGNVDSGQVSYIQTDLSSAKDHFEFVIYDMQNLIVGKRLNIVVKAQLRKSGKAFRVPTGEPAVITIDVLDASALAATTGSNPMYVITRPPQLGALVKSFSRVRRDADDNVIAVSNFTHEDIAAGVIEFRAKPSRITSEAPDSFAFLLTARNAQPSPGTFDIIVAPSPTIAPVVEDPPPGGPVDASLDGAPGDGSPSSTDPAVEDKAATTGRVGKDHLMVVFIVCGITLLIIIIFVVVKCFRRRRHKQEDEPPEQEDSKEPLSEPHMMVEPLRHRALVDSSDDNSSVMGSRYGSSVPVANLTSDFDTILYDDHRSRSSSFASRVSSLPRSTVEGDTRSTQQTPVIRVRANSQGVIKSTAPEPPMSTRSLPPPTSSLNRSFSPPQAKNPPFSRSNKPQTPIVSRSPPPELSTIPQSPRLGRIEVSQTMPTCKVTQLLDDDKPDTGSVTTPPSTPVESLKNDQVTVDWRHADPELLQHCRTTNPVLHNNKYWV
ncbi:Chondroitin sulfate proteoglycan 4 [Lamellibrachia satsuma]|nr:Chondroitin sulfate proteoglycan 4 [Lamellibrachia satsuma]